MDSAVAVVNRFYEITNDKRRPAGQVTADLRRLVADDITFIGPLMHIRGAAEYLALNEKLLPAHVETRMLRQFSDGNQVCSIYELVMSTPAGGRLTIPMADWIQVSGGRVVEQRIYYDPRQFATAFGMTERS